MDQKVVIILVVVGIFICCISAVLSIGGAYYYTKEDEEDDIVGSGSGGSGGGSGSGGGGSGSGSKKQASDSCESNVKGGECDLMTSGEFQAIPQIDGNFVIYGKNKQVVWESGTRGDGVVKLYLQDDGKLVLKANGSVIWSSTTETIQKDPYKAKLSSDDGNLIVENKEGSVIWESKKNQYSPNPNVTPTPVEASQEPPGSRIRLRADSALCMRADSKDKSSNVKFTACNNFDELQRFEVPGNGIIGPIKLKGTNQCVDIRGGDNFTSSHLWDCDVTNTNQKFKREHDRFKWFLCDSSVGCQGTNKHLYVHNNDLVSLDWKKPDDLHVNFQRFDII